MTATQRREGPPDKMGSMVQHHMYVVTIATELKRAFVYCAMCIGALSHLAEKQEKR